jgi:N utilization substance protein A
MNADLLAILDQWEREKGISRDRLFTIINDAIVSAAKKAVGPARDLRVQIDAKTGDMRAFAKLIVSERVASKHDQISVFDARRVKADAQVGEEVEIEVTPTGFGRIAAQAARQALIQRLRMQERENLVKEFQDRIGEIVDGVVRRFERSDVTVELMGKYEALLPNRERVAKEEYQIGERILCYVKAIEVGPHGPEIILSRSDTQFVLKLFRREVSEIKDHAIEIKAIAREPGFRTKVAVWTRDEKVDPVGACVGLRGTRVKNIVRELNNEKVDIIKWDPNIKVFLTNALAPARAKSFVIDEARQRAKIIVDPDQLSLAIGKRGQNARLTSRLTGWQVDIEAEETTDNVFAEKVAQAVQSIAAIPGIAPEMADILVHHGFLGLEDLLQVEVSDLQEIPEIGDQAASIMEAARAEAARRTLKVGDETSH